LGVVALELSAEDVESGSRVEPRWGWEGSVSDRVKAGVRVETGSDRMQTSAETVAEQALLPGGFEAPCAIVLELYDGSLDQLMQGLIRREEWGAVAVGAREAAGSRKEMEEGDEVGEGDTAAGAVRVDAAVAVSVEDRARRWRETRPLPERYRLARDCARLTWVLHRAGYAHLDLKPGNFLIRGERVVICDLGSSRCVSSGMIDKELGGRSRKYAPRFPDEDQSQAWQRAMPAICAKQFDAYAVGVTSWELVTGLSPWFEEAYWKDVLQEGYSGGEQPWRDSETGEPSHVLQDCWDDERDRADLLQILDGCVVELKEDGEDPLEAVLTLWRDKGSE
jgi:hypothetical protein